MRHTDVSVVNNGVSPITWRLGAPASNWGKSRLNGSGVGVPARQEGLVLLEFLSHDGQSPCSTAYQFHHWPPVCHGTC